MVNKDFGKVTYPSTFRSFEFEDTEQTNPTTVAGVQILW